ncbi:MAG TPA: DNA-binding domain-containing protein [Burkholderiaceae bacterium]
MSAAERQQALLEAVLGRGDAAAGTRGLPGVEGGAARGLQAYRGNAQGLAARTLASVYPRLQETLADNGFDAMAWTFWRRHPPVVGDLGQWGGALADFLAAQEGMANELVDLARLEWAVHEAEAAADDELDGASLARLGTHEPQQLRMRFRAGLQLLTQQSDGVLLVWRQGWRGVSMPLDAATAKFMQALMNGQDLDAALNEVSDAGDFDFSNWLQQALHEGWLLRIEENQE